MDLTTLYENKPDQRQPATTDEGGKLAPHHRHMLEAESAISPAIIKARGYFTITTPTQAVDLGFSRKQSRQVSERYPALIIPYHNPDGSLATYCMRPDNPRCIDDKRKKRLADGTYPQKVFKYEMVKGSGNVLDTHPAVVPHLPDPSRPLYFTEGAKKADSLITQGFDAINLNGVFGWRGTNAHQGKAALSAFDDIALNGRMCVLLFDSDVRDNEDVKAALRRFRNFLIYKQAKQVIPCLLPPSTDGGKTGIDDYFAQGHTAADLTALVDYWSIFLPDLGKGRERWTTEKYSDLFRGWGLGFAMNDMSEIVEVNGQRLDDTKADIIKARLMDDEIPTTHAEKAITWLADSNRYHPIQQYFLNLPKWDGWHWMEQFCRYIKSDDPEALQTWLTRWMIGAIAKVFEQAQNFCLVLAGPQGRGKSHLARWLCPKPLRDGYFLESPLHPDNKDCHIQLMTNFLWELGELGSITRRADREALKHFLTLKMVKVRRPYGKLELEKPAVASFIGTINPEQAGFLNDPTGNRRFVIAEITDIDWGYPEHVDLDQLWAEAYYRYKQGEPWQLTEAEAAKRDEVNSRHTIKEPLEDMVASRFSIDPTQFENQATWYTGSEILHLLDEKASDRGLTMRLANALKALGAHKHEHAKVRSRDNYRTRFYCGLIDRL